MLGADSQEWELMYPQSVSPSAGAQPLALVNPATGSCLSDPGWSTTNGIYGARLRIVTCTDAAGQRWRVR